MDRRYTQRRKEKSKVIVIRKGVERSREDEGQELFDFYIIAVWVVFFFLVWGNLHIRWSGVDVYS